MSDTMSDAAPAADAPTNAGDADYQAIADQLDNEGFLPSTDQADPDQQTDDDIAAEDEGEKIALKVNGKTIEKSLDEVRALAQKQIAGEAKLEVAKKEIEEARSVKQTAENQITAVKQLLGVLQRGDLETIAEFATEKLHAGDAFNKAVIQYALKLYEMSKMSPEQREAVENRKLVSKLRQEAEQRQQQDQERAMEYRINQWSQHIAQEVPKAIKQVGLTDTDFVREHIISTWRTAIERGQNPTPLAVASFVKKRLDDAKMLGQPKPQPPARPKATRDSVGLNRNAKGSQEQYMSWSDWQRTRGQ